MGKNQLFSAGAVYSQKGRLVIGTVLSLVCLILVFRGIQFAEVKKVLKRTSYLFLGSALIMSILNYIAIAIRWKLLFHPHHMPRVHRLFSALMIAQLANTVLPVRLSPLIRAYWVGEMEKISKAFVFSTILAEKILDGLAFALALGILLLLIPLPDWLRASWLSGGIIFVTLFLWLLLLSRYKDKVLDLMVKAVQFLPLLNRLGVFQEIRSALDSLDVWREKDKSLQLWGWSIAVWGITVLLNYFTLLALHIPAPFIAAVVLLVVLQAGIRIPSSPGNVGVFHYLSVLSLSLFSVDKAAAVSYGIVLHLLNFLPQSLLGVLYLWRGSYGFRRVLPQALRLGLNDLNE